MEDKEFDRLLKITRLKITDSEKERIKRDVEEVIGYFDSIDGIKTSEKPAYHPIDVPTRLRKDEALPFPDVEELKKPSRLHNGYILGPKL
ncbi:MAG TPA: Asp-tRNA(Asn)/Glu-tRNA(Gln) amidotransferase subunit GatC [Candidatus Saccharimonadales bacterium]|nr:Asp-tRNA(Asn)/Glu-tRNA(Gln) amidotransferase subunit GatC [Candidatus Saccharimonadales bacterium]